MGDMCSDGSTGMDLVVGVSSNQRARDNREKGDVQDEVTWIGRGRVILAPNDARYDPSRGAVSRSDLLGRR